MVKSSCSSCILREKKSVGIEAVSGSGLACAFLPSSVGAPQNIQYFTPSPICFPHRMQYMMVSSLSGLLQSLFLRL